jgi:hypothetical protein
MFQSTISKLANRILLLLVVVALLLPVQVRAENDHLIVPWRRVGPVALGMTAADVVRILGEPTQKNSGPVVTTYHWQDDLSVTVKTDTSYVTQICAVSPDYATAQGLRPGLPDTAAAKLMGEPQNSRLYRGWWKMSYTNLFWGGLMVSVPLTGFTNSHSIRSICVNYNA